MSEVREGYKMTELGVVPSEWEIKVLENTVEVLDGLRKPIKKNDRVTGNIPYYGATGVIDWVDDFIFDEPLILVGEDGENLRSRVLPMAFKIEGKSWVNNHAHVLKPKSETNIDFLTFYLESINYDDYITGSAQPKLNQAQLKKIKVAFPSFKEQKKIASILSTVDEQIDETEQLIVKTKELKKGLMQQLLTKGIGHTEFKQTELGEIPSKWKIKQLSDVLTVGYGKNQKDVEVSDGEIPILGTGGIIGWSNRALFDKPSVLIGRKGTIDKPRFIDIPFWTIDTLFYTDIDFEHASPKFIYYLFQTIDWYKYNEATGVPSLSASNISKILFACPSLEEQQKIAQILSTVDEQIEVYEQEKAKYEELKKGLMQQLLTGQIRVKI